MAGTLPPGEPASLPADLADAFAVSSNDGTAVAAYAWNAAPDEAPALLWGHANGFNAGCYRPFLARLATRFRVFAYDARGHGASGKPRGDLQQDYAMVRFGEDLAALTREVRKRIGPDLPLHYASHSLGGIAAVLLEGRLDQHPFASLTLFEPPIYPPPGHEALQRAAESQPMFVKWAARRREHFADRDELRREARSVSTFKTFAPEMLEAYVDSVAVPAPEGGLTLRCPGAVESAIYANCPPADVFGAVAGVTTRTRIYSADPRTVDTGHLWTPSTMRTVAASMPHGDYRVFPGGRHLMVQEQPERTAEELFDHVFAG